MCDQKEYGSLSPSPNYRTAFMGINEQNNENFPFRVVTDTTTISIKMRRNKCNIDQQRGEEEVSQNRECSIKKE